MNFNTPGGLFAKGITIFDNNIVFVLCHPVGDGPVNVDQSIIFEISGSEPIPLRVFNIEITGICSVGNQLYCVDSDCSVFSYINGNWEDWTDVSDDLSRINGLRVVQGNVHGLAFDGLIYCWEDSAWKAINKETEDLYLYDLAETEDGKLVVSGENGLLAVISGDSFDNYNLPTNNDLSSVLPIRHDKLLVTGWRATALIVGRDEIQIIDTQGRESAFPNAVLWKNHILIAGRTEVLELVDTNMQIFSQTPVSRLAAARDQLWKLSDDGVAHFVSGQWIDIPLSIDL